MHVEICTNSRIDLWELLESTTGKLHEELVQCLPPKNTRITESFHSPSNEASEQASVVSEDSRNTSLTIANIRNGYHLASSKLPFLWKLHEMLEDVEKTGDAHIVSWMPDGISFRVHKPKSFVQKIIPYYFNQSKFKSFQRQLHLYEFVRTPRGINVGAYSHPKFIRGKKSLCLSLSPNKIKNKGKLSCTEKNQGQEQPVQNPLTSSGERNSFSESPRKRIRADSDMDLMESSKKYKPMCLRNMILAGVPSSEWTQAIQNVVLVTGAALAAELESKKVQSCNTTECSATTPSLPHNGDVVYVFGGKPFRFIEEIPNVVESCVLDTCNEEIDDTLFSDTAPEIFDYSMVI